LFQHHRHHRFSRLTPAVIPRFGWRQRLRHSEGLVEIGDDIVDMLDADPHLIISGRTTAANCSSCDIWRWVVGAGWQASDLFGNAETAAMSVKYFTFVGGADG
jgi:hypothetical protein